MRIGYSLSPGGLLLPYHLGALDCLKHNGFLTDRNPIAGSSAGAIATICHASKLNTDEVIDATIDISNRCQELGGARGRLLRLLREKMHDFIGPEEHQAIQQRDGDVIVSYKELFPRYRSVHQTHFDDHGDVINAVCHSSAFPFFSTNWPVVIDTSKRIPRLVVDGFFTVPRTRFGCPDFEKVPGGVKVDRTVTISVFPQEVIGLTDSKPEDCISPLLEKDDETFSFEETGDSKKTSAASKQVQRLFRLATQASSAEELREVYESGWLDAERWCRANEKVSDVLYTEEYERAPLN